jgi:hypothetical protein
MKTALFWVIAQRVVVISYKVKFTCHVYIELQRYARREHESRTRGKCTDVTKGKGKAIPLQVWTGPEVSRRSRLPDFKTNST